MVASEKKVNVSAPYSAKMTGAIVPYSSNTTTVVLAAGTGLYSADYATLRMIGSQSTGDALNGTGATVAEWAIIGGGTGGGTGSGSSTEYVRDLSGPVFKRAEVGKRDVGMRGHLQSGWEKVRDAA